MTYVGSIHSNTQSNFSVRSTSNAGQLSNGRTVTSTPDTPFLSKVTKLALFFGFFLSGVKATDWECPLPKGPYLESCSPPTFEPYQSTDRLLQNYEWCLLTTICKKENPNCKGRNQEIVIHTDELQREKDLRLKNCNGWLVPITGDKCDERACSNEERRSNNNIGSGGYGGSWVTQRCLEE